MKTAAWICTAALLIVPVSAADPPGFALWKADDLESARRRALDARRRRSLVARDAGRRTRTIASGCSIATPTATPNSTTPSSTSSWSRAARGRWCSAARWSAAARRARANLVGTRLDGGERHAIGAGDIVHIPAGVPHSFLVPAGKHVTYVLLKILRPDFDARSTASGRRDVGSREIVADEEQESLAVDSRRRRPDSRRS